MGCDPGIQYVAEIEGNGAGVYSLIKAGSLIRRINLNQDSWL